MDVSLQIRVRHGWLFRAVLWYASLLMTTALRFLETEYRQGESSQWRRCTWVKVPRIRMEIQESAD